MQITDYLKKECIHVDVPGTDKDEIIRELANLLLTHHPDIDVEEAMGGLFERENVLSTGIGNGIAIPHARLKTCRDVYVAFGLLKEEANFESLDNKPVKLVFLIFFPEDKVNLQLKILAKVSRILLKSGVTDRLLNAKTSDDIVAVFEDYEKNTDSQ